jgi:hypothetical protein
VGRCVCDTRSLWCVQELLCPSCTPGTAADCPKHGSDYLEFKCRYCCSVSAYFCWGTSHFCHTCHENPPEMKRLLASGSLPSCPAGPQGVTLDENSCVAPLAVITTGCPVVSCRVLSCPVVSCRVLSCPVVSCRVVSCLVVYVVSCRVVSCRVVSCRVVSCRVVSCPAVSCRVRRCAAGGHDMSTWSGPPAHRRRVPARLWTVQTRCKVTDIIH